MFRPCRERERVYLDGVVLENQRRFVAGTVVYALSDLFIGEGPLLLWQGHDEDYVGFISFKRNLDFFLSNCSDNNHNALRTFLLADDASPTH